MVLPGLGDGLTSKMRDAQNSKWAWLGFIHRDQSSSLFCCFFAFVSLFVLWCVGCPLLGNTFKSDIYLSILLLSNT